MFLEEKLEIKLLSGSVSENNLEENSEIQALIGDTTRSVKILEISKVLKREKGFDYEVFDDEMVFISTPIGTLCIIVVNEVSNEIEVSFNMRLDPVTVVLLVQIINKVSEHIKMEMTLYEGFTNREEDDEILWGEEAYLDLGYEPLWLCA
jgi:hypothetical protein